MTSEKSPFFNIWEFLTFSVLLPEKHKAFCLNSENINSLCYEYDIFITIDLYAHIHTALPWRLPPSIKSAKF